MREKHIFLLYISSSSLKKRLTHAYGLTLMSLFIKIMLGNYHACPVITPKSFFFFFWRGNYRTPFLTIWQCIAWNQFHILKVHYLFAFATQINQSVLNCMVLIFIKQNIILKTRNQDFPWSKIECVIMLLKWVVRLIIFLFLVVYRSFSKAVLTIFRILFCKKPF